MRSDSYSADRSPNYDLVERHDLDEAEVRIGVLEAQVRVLKDEVASLDRTLRDLASRHI